MLVSEDCTFVPGAGDDLILGCPPGFSEVKTNTLRARILGLLVKP